MEVSLGRDVSWGTEGQGGMNETTTTSAPARPCPDLYGVPCRCPACRSAGVSLAEQRGEAQPVSDAYRFDLPPSPYCVWHGIIPPPADDARAGVVTTTSPNTLADFPQSGAGNTPQRQESASDRDPVTRPAHYALSPEPLDVIEAWGLPYHEANVLKYIVRWRGKNGVEDLRKAAEYLRRLIALAERADPA